MSTVRERTESSQAELMAILDEGRRCCKFREGTFGCCRAQGHDGVHADRKITGRWVEYGSPEIPQMEITVVGDGTQCRAYCELCQMGLNWWADVEGKDAAECYAARHNAGYPHQ